MLTPYKKVLEFHETYSCEIGDKSNPKLSSIELRFNLIEEEFMELIRAFITNDYVEVADALGDLVYVAEGAKITFGLVEGNIDRGLVDFYANNVSIEENVTFLSYAVAYLSNALEDNYMIEVETFLNLIVVKCFTIAKQLNIPLDEVIEIIHESNMSKLGEDGKPIYREEDNKVLKGPNYFAPTEKIKELLGANINA